MNKRPLQAIKTTIPQIKSFLSEIENRLSDCSPETLTKVASTLCFALHWMDKADEAKDDVLNAEFITTGEKENV